MKIVIRQLAESAEVLALSSDLERAAVASMAEFRDAAAPAGFVTRFLERDFDAPQTVAMIAETEEGKRCGMCVTGPLRDPLSGESLPTVLILEVETDFRHRGVARALVQETSKVLAARGETALAARAAHNDDALISMGERWGFVRQWELLVRD